MSRVVKLKLKGADALYAYRELLSNISYERLDVKVKLLKLGKAQKKRRGE